MEDSLYTYTIFCSTNSSTILIIEFICRTHSIGFSALSASVIPCTSFVWLTISHLNYHGRDNLQKLFHTLVLGSTDRALGWLHNQSKKMSAPPTQKTSPRETRGFSDAGIALAPRGTRATRNAVWQLRATILLFLLVWHWDS